MRKNSKPISVEERIARFETRIAKKKAYGRGFVQFGPNKYFYNVENKKGVLHIAFEGKNEIRAIASRDNVHQRARDVFLACMEFAYARNKEIVKQAYGIKGVE